MINRKIRNHIFILLLFVLLFLQITFFSQFFFGNYIPNVVLILLLAMTMLECKSSNAFYISFLVGFILNIFSGNYFGFIIIISILFAVFISSYLSYYFLKDILSYNLFLISSFSVLIYNVIYILLLNINDLQQVFQNIQQFFLIIIFQIIYTIILIYPLIVIISDKNEK